MPYVPQVQEVPDSLFIDNVLTIVKDDMKPALDYFYAAQALPDFAERMVGRFFKQTYPSFAIEAGRNGPQFSADGSFVEAALRLNLYFAVSDADAPTCERKAYDYTRALVSILRNASVSRYTTGAVANVIFALTWEISYEYGLLDKNANNPNVYEKPVNLELLLKFNER